MTRSDVLDVRTAAACVSLLLVGLGATSCSSNGSTPSERDDATGAPPSGGGTPTGDADALAPMDSLAVDLAATETSVPLGAAFRFDVAVHNPADASVGVDLVFALTAPSGEVASFHQTALFAPFGETTTEEVAVTPAQWFSAQGEYVVSASTEGETVAGPLGFEVTEPEVVVPIFEDVTVEAGLETSVPPAQCGQFSNGAAWGDVDADGDLDLFLTRLGQPAQLFLNNGSGAFVVSPSIDALAITGANGASFADYDNDGDPDLFVARDGSDSLLQNDGAGNFTDVSELAGIGDPDHRGITAAWADYDNDGHLDVHVANYMRCLGEWTSVRDIITEVEYHPNKLYRNNGDGTFTDETHLLENDPDDYYDGYTLGAGFGAAWIDYNGDNRPDLYLANDFVGPVPDHNRLWRNDGPAADGWRFTDVSLDSGTAFFMNTMGIGIGDFDRDLDLDMALSNIGANKLLRNEAGERFIEEASGGIGRPTQQIGFESITWGVAFHDLNLDGWEDLYLAAGNFLEGVSEQVTQQPNEVFVNDGTGELFLDVSAATGADDPGDSKGVAFADYDDDGDIDLFVVNQGGQPRLFRNVTPTGGSHWLQVETIGTRTNRDGCGAQVTLATDTGAMTRQVSCGSTSVASGGQRRVHFGLGQIDGRVRLEILWPSGVRQDVADVDVDQILAIEEPAE